MNQVHLDDVLTQGARLGLRHVAGPRGDVVASGVEIVPPEDLAAVSAGRVVIVSRAALRPFQVDVAVRRAIAAGCAALVFVGDFRLAETARVLATRGGLPVLTGAAGPSELAVFLDRSIRGGAEESLSRAEDAIARATRAAADVPTRPALDLLAEAGAALGTELRLIEDPGVAWSAPDAVCVGEVPMGRLVADRDDASVAIALPVLAALLSRSLQRELQARFGPARSRADLIVELVYAESSRIDGLAVEATRAGLPVSLSHAVAWLTPTHRYNPALRAPEVLASSIELYALQLVDRRDEVWHLAVLHDNVVIVASEEPGAPDHQRRLREVVETVVAHGSSVAGRDWRFTAGLGTPQSGAGGLRQSATEARIAAEAAIAGGRAGSIEATDVTGLRRVLLDFYASPLSRSLLDDILAPLDGLAPDRATTALQTLLAYLRNRNSLVRASAELRLHPNAVNYRIRRIEQTLGLDLTEPDTRFAVELACRVRLIARR
ncbi:PucR family transcriptional regulator [Solwaraspora sp. WMMB335]|uniref:PucR family transcriptional regulator n=1 Tax=Solwaraspora sp. WMMB335 TaxID=3404118 RepID=UPI003B966D42